MFNQFSIKKRIAFLLAGFLSTIMFFVGYTFYGLLGGIGFLFVSLILVNLLGDQLIANPFRSMLEGDGLLTLNMDSTGIIKPFISKLQKPYLKAKISKNKHIEDVFDRNIVFNLTVPKHAQNPYRRIDKDLLNACVEDYKAKKTEEVRQVLEKYQHSNKYEKIYNEAVTKLHQNIKEVEDYLAEYENGIIITLKERTLNENRFGMFHYPVLIYSEQIDSFITKDFYAKKEMGLIAEHSILYMNKKIEELTTAIRNFGRYVVDTLKPKENIFASRWFWIIIIVFFMILLVLFLPAILETLGIAGGTTGGAIQTSKEAISGAVNTIK